MSVLILRVMKGVGSRACIAFSYFSRAWTLPWQKPLSIQPLGLLHLLLLFLPCPWAYWLPFPPCWPIGLITSFLGLSRPIYFTFISCCAYEFVGCYSCHVGPLGLLPLSLSFPNPFTLLLLLVVPMGLLVVILAMLPIGVITFCLGFPRPIYFTFISYCAYGFVGCHSCHVGSMGLLPISVSFPFCISLLLGFFYC